LLKLESSLFSGQNLTVQVHPLSGRIKGLIHYHVRIVAMQFSLRIKICLVGL